MVNAPNIRRIIGAARRVLSIASGPVLVMAISIGAGPASAQAPAAPDLDGRWHDARRKVTYDIRRCDQGWCGAVVQAEKCGRVVLRLNADQPPSSILVGRLEPSDLRYFYPVRAFMADAMLVVEESTPANSNPMTRRMAPVTLKLSRTGPAICAAPAPVS